MANIILVSSYREDIPLFPGSALGYGFAVFGSIFGMRVVLV